MLKLSILGKRAHPNVGVETNPSAFHDCDKYWACSDIPTATLTSVLDPGIGPRIPWISVICLQVYHCSPAAVTLTSHKTECFFRIS